MKSSQLNQNKPSKELRMGLEELKRENGLGKDGESNDKMTASTMPLTEPANEAKSNDRKVANSSLDFTHNPFDFAVKMF
ncbi:hypothetical protein DdX_16884 [Ditylenchus destructor]|uniref:Uncharacterized protein n=1 Tax=Ditylenchus destructor TaxID=166010 RepID=A0AAD4MN84_9BILA|nr:hypothetical protein DdX_16884 [Ditylenchus destructor]